MSRDRTASFPPNPDDEFSAVLARYLESVDRGDQPDRDALLATYPHFADRLRAYFSDQERIERLAGPLRDKEQAAARTLAYEVLEEISRGGMGVVLRCRDRVLDRDLAIKVLLDHYRDQPDLVRRFVDEARITGQLQHPFIVPVHKLGTLEDGRPYFAMKLVQGRTLAELLRERTTPAQDLPRYLHIFEQICQTIAYAHSKGVIHRDLKPANVMVGHFGEVQVMDWGLAKILDDNTGPDDSPRVSVMEPPNPDQTHAGSVLGTFAYMPPEQATGDLPRVSRRSDVFGLGAILCEILTGMPPYVGALTEVRAHARHAAVADACARLDQCGADAELTDLARRCLAPDPEARPADGAAVADAVARYTAAVQERMRAAEIARARAETEAIEERKRVILAEAKAEAERKRGKAEMRRRRATLFMAASLSLLVIAAAGFGLWYQHDQAARQEAFAVRRTSTERDAAAALAEVRLRREEGLRQVDNLERWKLTLNGAWDALRRAENTLTLGEPTQKIRDEVHGARLLLKQDERDRAFFLTLERRWLEASSMSWEDVRAPRDVSFLTRAFTDYGLDLDAPNLQQTAALIRQHPQRVRLIDEISNIAHFMAALGSRNRHTVQFGFRGVALNKIDWSKAEKARQLLDAIDANPQAFGTRWRAARTAHDTAAMVKMAQALDLAAVTPRGAVSLANDLIAIGALDDAYRLLQDAHQRQPADFFLNQMIGIVAMARSAEKDGSLEEAIGYMNAALAIRGNNPGTHLFLGLIYKAQGKHEAALRSAHAAIAADPESAPAHHNLGHLYHVSKDLDKAIASFRRAADFDSVSALPFDALGQCYAEKGEYDEALRHYEIALRREPSFAGVYVNKGNALMKKNDVDGAIAQFRKALELFPDYGLAHNNLGGALLKKNEVAAAMRSIKTALECDRNLVQAYYGLGDLLLLYQRDVEGAIKAYEGPVRQFPKNANAHFQLANLLQSLGRHFQAVESYRKVIEIEPNHTEGHGRLALAYCALGQWNGAIDEFKIALNFLPNTDPATPKARALNMLGYAYTKADQWDKALECYQQALPLDPLDGNVDCNIGLVHMQQWRVEEAARAFRAALKYNARDPVFHRELASALLELGELDGSIIHANKSLELKPDQAEPYGLLAQVYVEKGEPKAALAAATKGVALLSPSLPDTNSLQVIHEMTGKFAKGEEILPAFFRGDARPADIPERNTLAMVAGLKEHRYGAAVRLLKDSFNDDPIRASNVLMGGRYRGVCFALRAAMGDGVDAPADEVERAKLRNLALEWLRADLEAWKRIHHLASATHKAHATFRVHRWLKEPSLEKVREPVLGKLPEAERAGWAKLWADVAAFGVQEAAPPAPAGVDIARLRKLADFPAVSTFFNVAFNTGDAVRDARGNLLDPAREIQALLPKLTGAVTDAEHYLDLSNCYYKLKQEDKSDECTKKAEALLRPYLKTNDRQEVPRLLDYARAFRLLHPEKYLEIEIWLRRAAELAPDDWQAWQALGYSWHVRTHTTILGRLPEKTKPNEAKERAVAGLVPAATLQEAEQAIREARKCFDRARELAPNTEKQWDGRIVFLMAEIEWQNAFRIARGKAALPFEAPPPGFEKLGMKGGTSLAAVPEFQAECLEAAERCPNHIGMQFIAMMKTLPALKARMQDRDPKIQSPLLTPRETQVLRDTIARIDKIRAGVKGEAALYCDRIQVCFLFNLIALDGTLAGAFPKIEPILRRLVEADPKDADAARLLEIFLVDTGNLEAGLDIAKKRMSNDPSTRNRYLLARAYDYCNQPEQAAKELDAALETAPDDPYCLAGRAALWLRHGNDKDLEKAGQFLDRARLALLPDDPRERFDDIEFLQAIHKIMTGHPVIGRLSLDLLHTVNRNVRRYQEALEASGP